MLLIVGLGNPGTRYARTRHNAGFEAVRALAERVKADAWREKFHGELARCSLRGTEALLLCPMTFMNDSGRSVQAAMAFYKVPVSELIVVHDELDLDFGTIRLKVGGGHAGHNGLRSIFQYIGTNDFVRLRIGIGHPPKGFTGEVADYVLSDLNSAERAEFPDVIKKATDALMLAGDKGVTAASNLLNRRPKPPKAKPGAAEGEPCAAAPSENGKEALAKDSKER
jgi:PTH1 family peptidyl-tRNA hydrolase